MGRINIEGELCKGCELCVHFCPKGLIRMSTSFNSKGYRVSEFSANGGGNGDSECTGCAMCARICPDVAIKVWR